jgi:hypothetical protein
MVLVMATSEAQAKSRPLVLLLFPEGEGLYRLRKGLSALCRRYEQESIALTVGSTEFVNGVSVGN